MSTIEFRGRHYLATRDSRFHMDQIIHAEMMLTAPDVVYSNGKHSHEQWGAVLDKHDDLLIQFLCVPA